MRTWKRIALLMGAALLPLVAIEYHWYWIAERDKVYDTGYAGALGVSTACVMAVLITAAFADKAFKKY